MNIRNNVLLKRKQVFHPVTLEKTPEVAHEGRYCYRNFRSEHGGPKAPRDKQQENAVRDTTSDDPGSAPGIQWCRV